MEQTNTEAELRYEATLASIDSGIISVDGGGHILTMSKVAEKMLGWRLDEVVGHDIYDVVPLTDEQGQPIPKEKRPMYIALMTGKTTTTTSITVATYFFTRKGETRFPAAVAVAPIVLDGKIIGAIDSFRDISEERALALGLAEEKAVDEAILESIGEGMIAINAGGIIIAINHGAEVILGDVRENFLGKNLYETIGLYDHAGVPVSRGRQPTYTTFISGKISLTGANGTDVKYFLRKKDGTMFPVSLMASPIRLEGEIIGSIAIFRAI